MNKILRMIVVLTVIGIISGAILALVYTWSLPKIVENETKATDAAIFTVLPDTKTYKKVVALDLTYYDCFDESGAKVGTAILCQGNGYQGAITLMVGVNADFTEFTGMTVLDQVETPGLGAKIGSSDFERQFNGLVTKPPIEYVTGGGTVHLPNEIQAITGATISSAAVVNIINKTVKEWLQIK
ncbi:MAG: RnfABCDGE type electron transport complex subunit G [Candidatus Saganbacteria bacterium]|nr:RnfABCDGE type electron transport complex subunit G [Candidatus Saganbacteria bacterium]